MKHVYHEVATLDHKCYSNYGLTEDLLMEHAAMGLQKALPEATHSILIISGPGNNGADGIALARMCEGLYDKVLLYLPYGAKSPMAQLQLERAQKTGVTIVGDLHATDVVVDALFGSGLSRPLDERAQSIVTAMNDLQAYKIACDIPSGIDDRGNVQNVAFTADVTVTMGALKIALFNDIAKDYVGKIVKADLGVSPALYESESDIFLLEREDLKLPLRHAKNCHKGNFGHLNVIAGKKAGAGIIAAEAAYAFGTGLVTIVENEPYTVPYELMSSTTLTHNATAICIGMGLGNQFDDAYLSKFLLEHDLPVLIDADLFYHPILKKVLAQKSNLVLTPHPKEFASLLSITGVANVNVHEIQADRFGYARRFSERYPDLVLVLKGANTLIVHQGKIHIQPFGSNILSKGGSGDVLGGLISALLAQGYSLLDAAVSGSIAHALSARNFTKNNYALRPSDLIEGVKCL